jgi:hydroxyethylthiazole kinase-like sugar kinase family protein
LPGAAAGGRHWFFCLIAITEDGVDRLARQIGSVVAVTGAVAHFDVSGSHAHEGDAGPGSFPPRFLDALHLVASEGLDAETSIYAVDEISA